MYAIRSYYASRKNRDRHDERGQQNQPEADTVNTHVVVHLEVVTDADPVGKLGVMHRRRGFENIIECKRQADEKGDQGHHQRKTFEQAAVVLGYEQQSQHVITSYSIHYTKLYEASPV